MKEFIEYIIRNLVDNPDQVEVNEVASANVVIFEIKVIKSDIGKIIGKKGMTINAIRTIIYTLASKNNLRVTLHIVE